jgi:peptidoglycan/LPS O-acetylase OafA/YrhL
MITSNTKRKHFRKDINGLRAIAVIGVILFHFNPSLMPGGFAGVDVFFVISGFLMTGIIYKGIDKGDFSIFKFYVARANRIIPALAVLCLVLLVFGWFYLTPFDYKALGKHAFGSMSFISNILYWRESGYFDASSLDKWLLHTWTLSVEWQFYIIYPLLIISVCKFFSKKAIKPFVLVMTIFSFSICVLITYKLPTAAYYLLPTRAWEMMIGGVAYLYPLKSDFKQKKLLEITGVVLILSSYFFASAETLWPGYMALFPVMGAFFIILAQRESSFITGNILFDKVGLWSYSIYLWHWPLVVAIYSYSLGSVFIYFGIFLSILLGFLSFKYLESLRFPSYCRWKDVYRVKPVYILVLVTGISFSIHSLNGVNIELRQGASSEKAKFLNNYAEQHKNLSDAYWLKCNTYTSINDNDTYETDPVCIDKKGEGGVFLWGDSHAEALSLGLRKLLKSNDIPFYQKTSAGCHASFKETSRQAGIFKKACDHSNNLAIESISNTKPTIVIIAQANGHDEKDWNNISEKLLGLGVAHVVIVGPVPQWKPSLPRVMIKSSHWKSTDELISDPGLDYNIIDVDKNMSVAMYSDKTTYLSLINNLCKKNDINEKYYCRAKSNEDDLLQVDYGHLSKSGSIFVVRNIISEPLLELYRYSALSP